MSETQTKSQSRSQGRSQTRSRSMPQSRSQGASQLDVDGVLVGKKVVIAVVVGNKVARITGTIVAMGRFWVIVSVEESEIPTIQGTVYLNKGSIIAYIPLPDNNPDTNHDSKTKA